MVLVDDLSCPSFHTTTPLARMLRKKHIGVSPLLDTKKQIMQQIENSAQEEKAHGRQPDGHAAKDDRGQAEGTHVGGIFPHAGGSRCHHGK